MAVLLLTYALNKDGSGKIDYTSFYKIRDTYDSVKLSESSYALRTGDSPTTVYCNLKTNMDPSDYIYVTSLKRPYSGFGPKRVNEWLEKNLPD